MSNFGGVGTSKTSAPKPPEKGVFPLDHFGECTEEKEAYMLCIKENKGKTASDTCKKEVKAYLECRMSKNLMIKQPLQELGFDD